MLDRSVFDELIWRLESHQPMRKEENMKLVLMPLLLLIFFLSACQSSPLSPPAPTSTSTLITTAYLTPTPATSPTPTDHSTLTPTPSIELIERYNMSPEAQVYLATALDFIQENSIKRLEINWNAYREDVYQRAQGARSSQELYPAIKFAVQGLHDGHSTFIPPDLRAPEDLPVPEIKAQIIEGEIGYIEIPSYVSLSHEHWSELTTKMHQKICEIDQSSPCGWIVDLRNNTGGGWFILSGIGPILGEGDLGAFVGPDGTATPWHYENGAMLIETTRKDLELVIYVSNACRLREPNPNVAVLTSGRTASAAETIVVAFKGRPGTRFFGEPTAGLTTGNRSHIFGDGAVLSVASTYYADRTGQIYNGSIRPDEIIFDLRSQGIGNPDMDPVMPAAVDWLLKQEGCKQ
jgi:carboxyl-terminal processing protease